MTDEVRDALHLVLMFFSGMPWSANQQQEWLRVTGSNDATTKVLCDHIRKVLAHDPARHN